MNNMKILAIAIIVAGALSLSYNTFTYTKDEHRTSIGPIDITTKMSCLESGLRASEAAADDFDLLHRLPA